MTSLVKAIQERLAKICDAHGVEYPPTSISSVNYDPAKMMAKRCAAAIRADDLSDLEPKWLEHEFSGSDRNASEQACYGCNKPLFLRNAWMEDGCPCNTPAGVNNRNLYRWKLLHDLQQKESSELTARLEAAETENKRILTTHVVVMAEAKNRLEAAEAKCAAQEQALRGRNCDDLCVEHIQRAEAAEAKCVELERTLRELRRQCDHEYRLAKHRAAGFLKTRQREHVNGFIAACEAVDAHRPCTCHPDDNPPSPCPRKYALSECRAAALKERK